MKLKGLGELCAATSDLANQTGIENPPKNKQIFWSSTTKRHSFTSKNIYMGHGNQRPEIELIRAFMPVLVTSNFDDDSIKNEWASMESQWSTCSFILRSNVRSYWTIIPDYHVHTSNSLQDIRQNHWTVKYRSCWPSLYDPQVNVTRLSHVWQTICMLFSKPICRNTHFKGVLHFDLQPHPGAWTLGPILMAWKQTP